MDIPALKRELMFSKATHNFTFSRDEVVELLGGYSELTTPNPSAGEFVLVPREPGDWLDKIADENSPPFGPPEKLTEEYCQRWRERQRKSYRHLYADFIGTAPAPVAAEGGLPPLPPAPLGGLTELEREALAAMVDGLEDEVAGHVGLDSVGNLNAAGRWHSAIKAIQSRLKSRDVHFDPLNSAQEVMAAFESGDRVYISVLWTRSKDNPDSWVRAGSASLKEIEQAMARGYRYQARRLTAPRAEGVDAIGHPRRPGEHRDEIELFLRDAYAAGCNAVANLSMFTAMEYAAREAPKLRAALHPAPASGGEAVAELVRPEPPGGPGIIGAGWAKGATGARPLEAALSLPPGRYLLYAHPAPAPVVDEACNWTQQDDGYDCYSTGCGHEFMVNDGPPDWPFCCYCAKPLVAVAWSVEADDAR